ncbi:MAG: hypothetical protein HPY83_19380 [Anaerolineae bacterium]|nr:hypothetical protein [Anaerolineae bacterium]
MSRDMTPRQRLWAAFQRQIPDAVPIALRMSSFLTDLYGPADRHMAELRAAREFGTDLVIWQRGAPLYIWTPELSYWDLPDVEVETQIRQEGSRLVIGRTFRTPAGLLHDVVQHCGPGYVNSPVILEPLVKDHSDVEKVSFLYPPAADLDLSGLWMLRDAVGEDGLVEVSFHSPLDVQAAELLRPAERLLTLPYDDPDLLRESLRVCQDAQLGYIRRYLESGERVIHVWWFYASMSFGWSPAIYDDFFYPLIAEQVDLVHSYGALYHYYDDGRMLAIVDRLRKLGVDIVSTLLPPPSGALTMAEAKARLGNRTCLMGGLDMINVLQHGSPQLVTDTVREIIEAAAEGGGLVIDVTNTVRTGTPVENVRAAVEAARRYGRY